MPTGHMSLFNMAPYFGPAKCFFWPWCNETLASGCSTSVACAQNTGVVHWFTGTWGLTELDSKGTRTKLLGPRHQIYGTSVRFRATSVESLTHTDPGSTKGQTGPDLQFYSLTEVSLSSSTYHFILIHLFKLPFLSKQASCCSRRRLHGVGL